MTVNHETALEHYIFKTTPYDHQRTALKHGAFKPHYGFLMEMGTGKSKVLVDNAGLLHQAGLLNFVLVIAPKGVYRNWISKEIPEHLSDEIPRRIIRWVSTANKTQLAEMRSVSQPFDGLTFFVMNVEAFSSTKGKAAGEWMAKHFGAKGMIAVDESTTIKNHTAKRTKGLIKIAKGFSYKRILTGSPITKAPLDIYSQADFLAPSILGHSSFYGFQNRYAIIQKRTMGNQTFEQVVGYRHLEELSDKINSFSYRVLKKDCLDLPEKIYTSRDVELSAEQTKMYEQIRSESILLLDNGDLVTAKSIITQMLRLQQVLSGHIKTDEGDLIEFESPRLDMVKDICEESSGKVIIWSRFRNDIERITKMLKQQYGSDAVATYYGDTSDDDRLHAVQDFQKPDHPLRFFVANPATAGYGITLTAATTVIYYACSFDLEHRIQSEDRAHRVGQTKSVLYIDLICPNSIDEKIIRALRSKIDIGAKVLGEEAREWLKISPKKK